MGFLGEVLDKRESPLITYHALVYRQVLAGEVAVLEVLDNQLKEWPDFVELVKARFPYLRLCLRVVEVEKPQNQLEPPAGHERAEVLVAERPAPAPVIPTMYNMYLHVSPMYTSTPHV